MLQYKLNEMFSLIHVILFLTFIFSSFLLYDKTAWRYVIFCPFSLADITEETDVMLFQKIKRARSPKRCSTSSKAQWGAPHICLHEKPRLAGERWSLWFSLLDSEMPHACKRSNRFLPTWLDMVAGGMKHTHKLILKCLHLSLMSLFERMNTDF